LTELFKKLKGGRFFGTQSSYEFRDWESSEKRSAAEDPSAMFESKSDG